MKYIGKLYGSLCGKYFETGHTTDEWDARENLRTESEIKQRIEELETTIANIYEGVYGPEEEQTMQDKITALKWVLGEE